jgi:hypothetical protein
MAHHPTLFHAASPANSGPYSHTTASRYLITPCMRYNTPPARSTATFTSLQPRLTYGITTDTRHNAASAGQPARVAAQSAAATSHRAAHVNPIDSPASPRAMRVSHLARVLDMLPVTMI